MVARRATPPLSLAAWVRPASAVSSASILTRLRRSCASRVAIACCTRATSSPSTVPRVSLSMARSTWSPPSSRATWTPSCPGPTRFVWTRLAVMPTTCASTPTIPRTPSSRLSLAPRPSVCAAPSICSWAIARTLSRASSCPMTRP